MKRRTLDSVGIVVAAVTEPDDTVAASSDQSMVSRPPDPDGRERAPQGDDFEVVIVDDRGGEDCAEDAPPRRILAKQTVAECLRATSLFPR